MALKFRNDLRTAKHTMATLLLSWLTFLSLAARNAGADSCATPPNFPPSVNLTQENYINWAQGIVVPNVWTATPRNTTEVLLLANWAATSSYKLRAMGYSHTWAPTTITPTTGSCPNIILVSTLPFLNKISLVPSSEAGTGVIRVQTGASMLDLLTFAEANGFGLHNHPASGDHSVGGVQAIGGHGCGVLADGATLPPGYGLGTVSNLLLSATVTAWDADSSSYALRTFTRGVDEEAPALLAHLGRTIVTEVTLRAGPLTHLRCESLTDVPAAELFANPTGDLSDLTTIESLMNSAGSFEIILFAFTDTPWLKVWTVSPTKPLLSRQVNEPFNYPFSYLVPPAASSIIDRIIGGEQSAGALLGPVLFAASDAGLTATLSRDLWGPAKNVLLFVKPTTVRTTNAGFCILTARINVQLVSYTIYTFYTNLLNTYADRGEYPINIGMELRVGGVDNAEQIGLDPGTALPWLSSAAPHPTRPEFDSVIWFEILTLPSTPLHAAFLTEVEQFLLSTYGLQSEIGLARPEWSKGWAYTLDDGWANTTILQDIYGALYPEMAAARAVYAKYDPQRVFSNEFLDSFL